MSSQQPTLIVIVGPTAVGKTNMAIELSNCLNAPILSADSRQFYKEISIGTAKPTMAEQKAAPHFFIDNKSIQEDYNASDFEEDVINFLSHHFQSNQLALLCGGSGMYINAVCNGFDAGIPSSDEKIREQLAKDFSGIGIEVLQKQLQQLDPEFYKTVDKQNSKRLMRAIEVCLITGQPYSDHRKGKAVQRPFNILKIGLEMPRKLLYERINHRVELMMKAGLLEEVKAVEQYKEKNALQTVGYRELFLFLEKKYTLSEAIEKIKVNSRRYAKRQLSWFKRDKTISWFNPQQKDQILKYLRSEIGNPS